MIHPVRSQTCCTQHAFQSPSNHLQVVQRLSHLQKLQKLGQHIEQGVIFARRLTIWSDASRGVQWLNCLSSFVWVLDDVWVCSSRLFAILPNCSFTVLRLGCDSSFQQLLPFALRSFVPTGSSSHTHPDRRHATLAVTHPTWGAPAQAISRELCEVDLETQKRTSSRG